MGEAWWEGGETSGQDGGIEVWLVSRGSSAPFADHFEAWADANERMRVARLIYPDDRAAYRASHAVLRAILGDRISCDPALVRICAGFGGKPRLVGPVGSRVRFNLSHTKGWTAVALGFDLEVGIDIEVPVTQGTARALADEILSAPESAWLNSESVPDFAAALIEAWSAKEAALKLLGVGLRVPPRNVKLQHVGSHRYGVCLNDSRGTWPGEIHVSGFATSEYTACLATYEIAPSLTFRRFPQDLSSAEFGAGLPRSRPSLGRN